jgi:hypothetical protein
VKNGEMVERKVLHDYLLKAYRRQLEDKRGVAVKIVDGKGRNAAQLKENESEYQHILGQISALYMLGIQFGINLQTECGG